MSDLPDRLRRKDATVVFVASDGEKAVRLMTEAERREEAADEIERLTAALLDVYALIPPERVRLVRPHAQECITEALSDE
ncbi:MAG: hypothetical protein ACPGVG_19900 [Mycobacterium sp.]